MKLLYPEYLWALSAIAIPIIIHLFNFRKFQKIYFSNIDLLKEVKLETKSKSQLKHLIILAVRILAIIVLVLAFCQPYVPTNEKEIKSDTIVSLFIDNSHSMDSKGENGYNERGRQFFDFRTSGRRKGTKQKRAPKASMNR